MSDGKRVEEYVLMKEGTEGKEKKQYIVKRGR